MWEHEHIGDLHIDGEDLADTAKRIRAHLGEALPKMGFKVRMMRSWDSPHIRISITRHSDADLSNRAARLAANELIRAEIQRFERYWWNPHHGFSRLSFSSDISVDPSAHAATPDDAPEIDHVVSFAQFTRSARPGDLLEHVAGVQSHLGERLIITAISARRLTIRSASAKPGDRDDRMPIQGGACFTCDGDLICFRHSAFANQGGYSLVRWIRQP